MPLLVLPISDLKKHVNPLNGAMWKCRPIDEAEVWTAVEHGTIEPRTWQEVINTLGNEESRQFHINRIATLIAQPSKEMIVVIAENHMNPVRVYVYDGNHRLAAAYVRGDAHISALVAASEPGSMLDVFPGAMPAEDDAA
jgi:hypothetical protein